MLDITEGGTLAVDNTLSGRSYIVSQEIDCAEIAVPSDGIVKAINVPADHLKAWVRTKVITEQGAALDIDVGDSGDTDAYGDALDGNDDTVDNVVASTRVSASADYIRVMFKADGTDNAAQPDKCKIRVTACLIDMSY